MRVLLLFLLSVNLFASDLSLILEKFAKKNDLSNNTKIENRGILILYTHEMIETMQAHTLKDLLKSLPFTGYKITRFAVPAMMYNGGFLPVDSSIKLYLDNHEVMIPSYSSSFAVYGDIDLGNIEYVEVYYINPSFENYSDSGTYIIKLYTKDYKRYQGLNAKLSIGNRGYKIVSGSYDVDNTYFYVSRFIDKNQKLNKASRNQYRNNLFFKTKYKNSEIMFNLIKNKKNTFLASSLDGNPDYANTNYYFFVLGYKFNLNNFNIKLTFDRGVKHAKITETPYLFFYNQIPVQSYEYKTSERSYIGEINYKKSIKNHKIILGSKYSYNSFPDKIFKLNDIDQEKSSFNHRRIFDLYSEYQYLFDKSNIFGVGLAYVNIVNKKIKNTQHLNYKLHYTHRSKKWLYKLFFYNLVNITAPYIYNSLNVNQKYISDNKEIFVGQEIKRYYKNSTISSMMFYNKSRITDYKSFEKDLPMLGAYISVNYNINIFNTIFSRIEYAKTLEKLNGQKFFNRGVYIRYLGKLKNRVSLFNEILLKSTNYISDKKWYLDWNLGVKKRFDNLILALKGENILNRGFKESFYVIDGYKKVTLFDRKIIASMEYVF